MAEHIITRNSSYHKIHT